ncbi:MAG: GntR family transcriptional regulator [Bacillota bacterium]
MEDPRETLKGIPAETECGKASLRQQAYRFIRKAIIEQKIAPGSLLAEKALSETLGMSKTPIREALTQLEKEGLVRLFPRKGAFVREVAVSEARDIYILREHLECLALDLGFDRMDHTRLDEFERLFTSFLDHPGRDHEAQLVADRSFHDFIADSGGNPVLAEILCMLHDRTQMIRVMAVHDQPHMLETFRQHLSTIRYIKSGNKEGAVASMREHLVASRNEMLRNPMSPTRRSHAPGELPASGGEGGCSSEDTGSWRSL